MSTQPQRGLAWRLYHGETAFNFIGRRNQWFAVSGLVILIGLGALGFKGLNFGIDFKGGTSWEVPAAGVSVTQAKSALASLGLSDPKFQTVGSDIRVQSKPLDQKSTDAVTQALAKLGKTNTDRVAVLSVGPSWGKEVSSKAERALVVFFFAIFCFIWFRFQWKMSVAALVAVIHDILVTVGVYAVFGFPVTPATVVAVLTILGYSLYDTVVVFDKVDENTKGLAASGRMTYADTVNLSMNQVLMRSINTSLVAIMPIASVLVIGDIVLGASTLREFGLALFVGLITGAYSSIFVAAPLLAMLKEREPRYAAIRDRIESRGTAGALLTPAAAAAERGSGGRSKTTVPEDREPIDDEFAAAAAPASGSGAVLRPSGSSAARSRPPGTSARPRPSSARPAPRGRKKGKRR